IQEEGDVRQTCSFPAWRIFIEAKSGEAFARQLALRLHRRHDSSAICVEQSTGADTNSGNQRLSGNTDRSHCYCSLEKRLNRAQKGIDAQKRFASWRSFAAVSSHWILAIPLGQPPGCPFTECCAGNECREAGCAR